MQRLIMSLVLLAMFVGAALTAAPLVVDPNTYKEELVGTIRTSTGLKANINGDVKISFFPYPVINVRNVSVENVSHAAAANIIYVESIRVESSFIAVFSGRIDIKAIELVNPVLEIEQLDDGTKNWNIFRQAFKDRDVSAGRLIPDNISIINGTVAYRANDKKRSVDYIHADVNADSVLGPFELEGSFSSSDSVVSFEGEIGKLIDGSKSVFELRSDNSKLKMLGEFRGGDNPGIKGQVEGDTSNLKKFSQTFFDVDSSLSKIKSEEVLDFYGNFDVTKKTFSFENLAIVSESFKGRADIDALIGGTTDGLEWDVSIEVDKIDFDTLFKEKETNEIDYYASTMNKTSISDYTFDVPNGLTALIKLYVNNITYNNQKIENLAFDVDVFGGKAIVNSFSAALPGESEVTFSGNVDHNGTRPLLKGIVKLSGKSFRDFIVWMMPSLSYIPEGQMGEYLFESDLKMTPQKVDISEMHLSFDQTLITGDISARPAREEPVIKADIKIDRLNLDKYYFTKEIAKHIKSLRDNLSDTSLEASWLKLMSSKLDIYIDGKDITYNGKFVENMHSVIIISRGIFALQRFFVDSSHTKLDSSLLVDLNSEQPVIEAKVSAALLDTELFLGSKVQYADASRQLIDGSYWSKKSFNLMGIDRFKGSFDATISEIKHDNTYIDNVVFKASLAKKLLNIDELSGNFLGGRAVFKGGVGVIENNPSFGISYVVSNIDFSSLAKIADPLVDTQGKFFLSGTAKTFGENPFKWASNLIIDSKFVGRGMRVNKFNLSEIVTNSRKVYSVIDMDVIVQKAMEEGGVIISSAEGVLKSEKGVLKATDFKLQTKYTRGAMVGNISLLNGDVAASANLAYAPERSKKVTLGLSITGNIENVERKLDTTNLESYITSKGSR